MPGLKKEQYAAMNNYYRLYPLDYFLDAEQAIGVKSIELHGTSPHVTLSFDRMSDFAAIRGEIESRGMKAVAFTPESVTYQFTLGAEKPELKEKSFLYFKNAVLATKELGAKIMPVSCAGGMKDRSREEIFANTAEALKRLAPVAEEAGVTIAVETLTPDVSVIINTIGELKDLLEAVGSPAVKACLDICSARTAGETIDQWFDTFGKDLVHIHFTDGRPAGRLVWGMGLHPLDDYLETLEKYGYTGALGMNMHVRGNWVDPSLIDPEKGWTGTEFTPENYWFAPAAASRENFEAFRPYFTD